MLSHKMFLVYHWELLHIVHNFGNNNPKPQVYRLILVSYILLSKQYLVTCMTTKFLIM